MMTGNKILSGSWTICIKVSSLKTKGSKPIAGVLYIFWNQLSEFVGKLCFGMLNPVELF